MGKNWAGPVFPHPDLWKYQTCAEARLSGWRKTGPAHSFPTPTNESINLTLSWICKQPLLFRGWGKTGPAHSFPTLTSVSINLVQKLGYLGGEKLGRPILSPIRLVKVSTLSCHEYSNNLCFLGGGGKLGRPILSPPRQDNVSTLCRWLSGWRKTRLVCYFPTLTSEGISLTLSWIHIQHLLFRGWGKTWPAHSFPTLTRDSINLVQKLGYLGGEKLGRPILSPTQKVKVSAIPCHEYANNLCFLGDGENWAGPFFPHPNKIRAQTCADGYLGGEKLGWSISFPPWKVKASTLPCHEYTYNLCLLGGGEKLGWPSLSPPWLVKVLILCRS